MVITSHVLVQLQRHTNVADLDGLKVALDDNVTRLHVAVQQLLLIVKILQRETNSIPDTHGLMSLCAYFVLLNDLYF